MRKDYNPTPVYHRKTLRSMIRHAAIQKYGYHNVSNNMRKAFNKMRHEGEEE